MKILCFGSRNWEDRSTIIRILRTFPAGTIVVHGANGKFNPITGNAYKGADLMCAQIAAGLGFAVRPYPADFSQGGKGGPIRNAHMLQQEHKPEEKIDFGVGFSDEFYHPSPTMGKGTKGMHKLLIDAMIPTEVYSSYKG